MDDLDALRDQIRRLRDVVAARGGPPGDLVELTAHAEPAAAVRMAGRAPLCGACSRRMPCPPLRELAGAYGFDEWTDVPDDAPSVVLEHPPNVTGPTGVVLDTGDEPDAARSGDPA
jgi:hypothetical protein